MLSKRQKQGVVRELGETKEDTGSAGVQIGLLTKSIKLLTIHLKKNPKDHHSRRGLLMMVGKRRSFLKYLKRTDEKAHDKLVKKLEIE